MQAQENCVVCMVSMKRKPVIRLLSCKHMLHEACSRQIIDEGNCPICRAVISGTEQLERRQNTKYSAMDRARIVEAANRGDDWPALASSFGVKYKTAFSWVQSGRVEEKVRGGNKPKSLSDREVDAIIEWVEQNCSISLKEIGAKFFEKFQKRICMSTISNYLEGLSSTKSTHCQPVTMNNTQIKNKRAEYVRTLSAFVRSGKQIMYIDETNFNLFCRRNRGRSRTGTRAIQTFPASRGPNVHLIGAIYTSGVISMDRRKGSFKSEIANDWIVTVMQKWLYLGNSLSELVIVCDNAPCHSKLEGDIAGFNHTEKATLLRLGPYSPMLNPIENIWSKIKSHVKSNMTIPSTTGPGVGEQRLSYLESLIDEAKSTVTGGDCGRSIQHSTSFFADALALNDMPVGM